MNRDGSGLTLLIVAGGLVALLVFGSRSFRSGARDLWRRTRLLRWVLAAVAVLVLVELARSSPRR
ncbi:MAG TPA: hypothetical protein VKP11_07925 [Frankiaceae bacterium]|nr:hypothetical protein [Frankiaceae bacterium]